MKNKIDVEIVVKDRLRLQSVQRNFFDSFGILFPTLEKFKHNSFLHQYNKWELEQKNKFLIELGGKTNLKQTKQWIDKLIKEKLQTKESNETLISIHPA
jgi:hypothetical protein